MSDLPASARDHLAAHLIRQSTPAYILVDKAGQVQQWGGDLARYHIESLRVDEPVTERLPFLVGILPLADQPYSVPCLEVDNHTIIHLLVYPGDQGDWVMLLDARSQAERQRPVQQSAHELELLRDRLRANAVTRHSRAARDTLADLLYILDTAVLERQAPGRFRLIGQIPVWLRPICRDVPPDTDVDPGRYSAFLENFLTDAERLWTETSGTAHLSSGPWTETDAHGEEYHLEAVAAARDDLKLLIIQTLGSTFEAKRELVQRARENSVRFFRELTDSHKVTESLRRERDAATSATRAKSDFLARMSHELRTPLNAIIGFGNILLKNKRGHLDTQELLFLSRIKDNGVHLLSLINDILDLSKIEAGRVETDLSAVSLGQLVAEIVGELEPLAARKGLALRTDLPARVEDLVTDRRRLKQVLINLAANALQFTTDGWVTIAVEADAGVPRVIAISDTGIGIPLEDRSRIFEAFQQSEHAERPQLGTGLGLSITRALVELLGHRIELESEPGRGSTFRILLDRRAGRAG